MSKFFKALENAEREREAEATPAPVEATTTDVDSAEMRPPTVPPARERREAAPPTARPANDGARETTPSREQRDGPPAATSPAGERRDTAPPTPRTAAPAPVAPPVSRAGTTVEDSAPPTTSRTTPPSDGPARVERDAAPRPARLPVYGAPTARDAVAHGRAFDGVLPPPSIQEPGEIDDHLVSLLEPTSLAAERYRTVRLHLEDLHRERDVRLVAVSSPSRGDGKTISAINLAGALAQAPDARVALVEVDVRHPGMARYLGLSPHRGLSSYLLDTSLTVDDVLEQPSGVGFAVVVAGPASSMPYELLKSPRLGALLAELRQRFDVVLLDTPPVLPFPDVGIVRNLVDGFLLVVRANCTPREMVHDSLGVIGTEHVFGVVFNDDERSATTVRRDEEERGWRAVLPRARGGTRAA